MSTTIRTFWADSPKSLAICSGAAMALGGSGCSVWLSTTFVSGGKATASTATTATQAAIMSQGARTTKRPSIENAPMPVLTAGEVLAAADFLNMTKPFSGVSSVANQERSPQLRANCSTQGRLADWRVTFTLPQFLSSCGSCEHFGDLVENELTAPLASVSRL